MIHYALSCALLAVTSILITLKWFKAFLTLRFLKVVCFHNLAGGTPVSIKIKHNRFAFGLCNSVLYTVQGLNCFIEQSSALSRLATCKLAKGCKGLVDPILAPIKINKP